MKAYWKDDPVVIVSDGNFNRALRLFKSRLDNLKIFPLLKMLDENAKASDRRKAKAKRAALRELRKERFRYEKK
jgi:ribosomal protein S21